MLLAVDHIELKLIVSSLQLYSHLIDLQLKSNKDEKLSFYYYRQSMLTKRLLKKEDKKLTFFACQSEAKILRNALKKIVEYSDKHKLNDVNHLITSIEKFINVQQAESRLGHPHKMLQVALLKGDVLDYFGNKNMYNYGNSL